MWFMDADGSDQEPIDTSSTASTFPRPSPGSNEIYFYWGLGSESDAGLYSINIDSTILPAQSSSYRFLNEDNFLNVAQWSPDGNRLLSRKGYSSTTMDLVLLNRDGTFDRRITSGLTVYLGSHAWSHDSNHLVFDATFEGQSSIKFFKYDVASGILTSLSIGRGSHPN